ncbi:GH39 family glycosyl hydrolase [Sinomicrobium sp. M5D2P17]
MNNKVKVSLIVFVCVCVGGVTWYNATAEDDENLSLVVSMSQDSVSVENTEIGENNRTKSAGQRASRNITVDVAQKETNVKSMVGFLHSFNNAKPDQQFIDNLEPKYWRVGKSSLPPIMKQRTFSGIRQQNAKPILTLGSFYSYPREYKNKKWRAPARNDKGLLGIVEKIYLKHRNNAIYDVWNEPNLRDYWSGTEEEFFKVFKTIHDKIRSLPGGDKAIISGPSISRFDKRYLSRFFNFCIENNIRLDVISWHENENKKEQTIYKVKENLEWARENWINNNKKLGAKKIIINEMMGNASKYSPSVALLFFKQLEDGGADGACKACWRNSNKKSDCFNNSLDGLLSQNGKPRSIWWAYKYYAESTKSRLQSDSDSPELISFAYSSDKGINVLVGTGKGKSFSNTFIKLKNIGSETPFSANDKVKVACYSIPDSGDKELEKPILQSSDEVSFRENSLEILLDDVKGKSVCLVKITKI